jgi:hypothetical protein
MDPCPFVRLTVGNLALKIPVASKPARSVVHPSSSPCFCKIRLKNFPLQTAVVPFITPENQFPEGHVHNGSATFHLSKSDLDKVAGKSIFAGKLSLRISIYTGRRGTTCGVNSGRLLAKAQVFQIQGNIRQPVFTCKFSFRSTSDRNQRCRLVCSGFPFLFVSLFHFLVAFSLLDFDYSSCSPF